MWLRRYRGKHERVDDVDQVDEVTPEQAHEEAADRLAATRARSGEIRQTADSLEQRVSRENHIGLAMIDLFRSVRT